MSGWFQVIPQLPGNAPSRNLQGIPAEFESGIEEVHQVPVFINDSVLLPGLFCSPLGTPGSRREVVNVLRVMGRLDDNSDASEIDSYTTQAMNELDVAGTGMIDILKFQARKLLLEVFLRLGGRSERYRKMEARVLHRISLRVS